MAKNYMADVAKLLGVELRHVFQISGDSSTFYKFTKEGLFYYSDIRETWQYAGDYILLQLLRGNMTIKKSPWKPKEGETYFFVLWNYSDNDIFTNGTIFRRSCATDCMFVDCGNCFKDQEDAEAQKYKIFKRLTGKDWHETYGKEGGNNATN